MMGEKADNGSNSTEGGGERARVDEMEAQRVRAPKPSRTGLQQAL